MGRGFAKVVRTNYRVFGRLAQSHNSTDQKASLAAAVPGARSTAGLANAGMDLIAMRISGFAKLTAQQRNAVAQQLYRSRV
jgi:hypothetical protein